MLDFEFMSPTQFVFGRGAEEKVGGKLAERGAKKVLLHFGGQSAVRSGLIDRVCASLDAAGVVVMEKSARYLVEVDYSTWQRLEYFLRSAPVIIEQTEFGASVVCTLMVRVRDAEHLLAEITRVTDGKAETLEDGTLFYPWPT